MSGTLSDYLFTPQPASEYIYKTPDFIKYHIGMLVVSFSIFCASASVIYFVIDRLIRPEFYVKKEKVEDRIQVATLLNCAIHHLSTCANGFYIIFYMNPSSTYMGVLFDPEPEYMEYVPLTSMMVVFTLSYFAYDYLVMKFIVKNSETDLGKQHKVHHIICILLAIFALGSGMMLPKLFCIAMMCESSMIFLNYRNMLGKNNWKGTLSMINSVVFFLTYTVFRIVLFPILIYSHIKYRSIYDFYSMSFIYKAYWWFSVLLFTVIICLNIFWYKFIVKGIVALFKK